MADLFFNIADQVKLFNEFISKGVIFLFESESMIFDQIRKDWEQIEPHGKFAKQRVIVSGSQSHGARSDASYPESQTTTPAETLVYMKRAQMWSQGFDGLALEAALKGGAAMKPEDFEDESLFIGIADDLSRQLMMDGSGRLCQVNGGGAAQTQVVDSPYFKEATKFMRAGQVIETWDATTTQGNGGTVEEVVDDTHVKFTGSVTLVNDYYMFKEKVHTNSEGAGLGEAMGLAGIISEADPPYPNASLGLQALTVAAYPAWKSAVLAHGGITRPLHDDLFIRAINKTKRVAKTDVILCSEGVYRSYYKILTSYKVLPNIQEFWGGWAGLVFIHKGKRIPVVDEPYVPDGYAMGISKDNLVIHVLNPNMVTWEKGEGGILKQVAGYNRYKAEGHIFLNLGVKNRRAFWLVKDIEEPSE